MKQVGLNWGEEVEGRVEKGVQRGTHPPKTFQKTSGLNVHDVKFIKNQ